MKETKILVATLIAGFVLHQSALCQTNTPGASPADAGVTATNPPASDAAGAGSQPVSITASNEPVAGVSLSNAAPDLVASNATAVAGSTNSPAANLSMSNASPNMLVSNAIAEANLKTASNAVASAAAERPISLQDVSITAAIEALAREAGINYLLDPKIGYGQPDQNGQIKAEPTLSIRWEHVTAQQALLALLDNYSLQLVENPKTGIAKITTKEPNALPPLITRVVQLKYASTSNMMGAVVGLLSGDARSKVVPDARTSQLVVIATETAQSSVDMLLTQLDKPTRQVLIETKLVELSSNPSTTKGVDWSGTLQAQNVSFGNGVLNKSSLSTTTIPGTPVTTTSTFGGHTVTSSSAPGSSTSTTLSSDIQNSLSPGGLTLNTLSGLTPGMGFLSADGAKAVLSFLNSSSEAQVVSTPRVVTLDNETATISVTRNFPIINVTASTAGVSSGSSQITYSNIGTILQVTPRITANDYIWLKVVPDVSSFFGTVNKTVAGVTYQADEFDTRHIETQVLIPNAHTLVMGGMVKDNPNAQYTKVPILGDIPVLGLAFRSQNKTMDKDNLLIFITPTIVQDADFKPTTSDFLNSTPRTMADPMKMHTWLDSSQPRGDWSNPISPDETDKIQNPDTAKAAFAPQ